MNRIVEKAMIGVVKTTNFILQYSPQITAFLVCITIVGLYCSGMVVSADDPKGKTGGSSQTANTLMQNILKIIGYAANVMGVGVGALAIMHFASAQADGDGPAKTKAIQQIAAAAVLLAVGILLSSGPDWLLNNMTAINLDSGSSSGTNASNGGNPG